MKKTVAKIIHNGTYRIVHDDSTNCNPYTIYKEWHDMGKHSKTIAKYSDMTSCLYHIAQEYNLYGKNGY